MAQQANRKLILADGQEFRGFSFGAAGERLLELVCNTSMVGYQEIFSDPSYTDQAVVMSYPLIGNYGMAADDYETLHPTIGALIVREYNDEPSNFRSVRTLGDVMQEYGIAGLSGVDTRKLCRVLRDTGTQTAMLTDAETTTEEGLMKLRAHVLPRDAVSRAACRSPWEAVPTHPRFHVVAIDCGMKRSIVRALTARGCRVSVVPWNTSAASILALRPDGLFLSNGPGDPTDVPETIQTVRTLLGRVPIFGICLGHQILALAYGAGTYKLKFGHRGGNHPVRDLETGQIEITSQNHSYAVDEGSLGRTPLTVTHRNLLDGTVEGLRCAEDRAFSVQYHPESAPGPQDSAHLFDRFVQWMEEKKHHAETN